MNVNTANVNNAKISPIYIVIPNQFWVQGALPLSCSIWNPISYCNQSEKEQFIHFQFFWSRISHRKVRQWYWLICPCTRMARDATNAGSEISSAEWKSSCSLKWDWVIYGCKLERQQTFSVHLWCGAPAKKTKMEPSSVHHLQQINQWIIPHIMN